MIASLLAVALQSSTWIIPPLPDERAAAESRTTSPSAKAPGQDRGESGTKVTGVVVGAPGIGWTRGSDASRCGMTGFATGSKAVPVVRMLPAVRDGSVTAPILDPGSSWQNVRVADSPAAETWIAGALKRYGAQPAVVLRPEKGSCRYDAVVVYTDDESEFVGVKGRPRLSPLVQCPPLSCLKESIDGLRTTGRPNLAVEMAACSDRALHPTNRVVVVAYERAAGFETVSVVDRAETTRSYFTGASPYSCVAGTAR